VQWYEIFKFVGATLLMQIAYDPGLS